MKRDGEGEREREKQRGRWAEEEEKELTEQSDQIFTSPDTLESILLDLTLFALNDRPTLALQRREPLPHSLNTFIRNPFRDVENR